MQRNQDEAHANDAALARTAPALAIADTVIAPATPSSDEFAEAVGSLPAALPHRRENAASIGRFLLLRKLGEGGMGEVYLGYDEKLDRKVAIKLLLASNAPEDSQKRTIREAQALARLSHPNVVAIYEVGQMGGDVFVVMEHIDGVTLLDWQNEPSRTVEEILQAYILAGRGLAAVHASGMIHRDFKPHNAMIDHRGRVRILDFGLAHARGSTIAKPNEDPRSNALTSQLTVDGAIAGTPAYMSPEQFMGGDLDARSDQFSFCVALYEALYKQLPSGTNTKNKIKIPALVESFVAPPERVDIPSQISKAIMRGLSKESSGRFPDMDELLQQLEFAPRTDPTGQARQRILYGIFLFMTMGAWAMAPETLFTRQNLPRTVVFMTITVAAVGALGAYVFRNTLLRNSFHRDRIVFLLIMGGAIFGNRVIGMLHGDSPEANAIRDLFCTWLGAALGAYYLRPRVLFSWITLALATIGLVAFAIWPQYLAEETTFVLNFVIIGFFIAWHRSSRIAPVVTSTKADLILTRSTNKASVRSDKS